mmetsp:Transcript_17307/g.16649  ORF Transcript_17307/g.16649 Transcript_17307/m.16649 type:complete len:415 (-) Transcript_17307:10-1254(-)
MSKMILPIKVICVAMILSCTRIVSFKTSRIPVSALSTQKIYKCNNMISKNFNSISSSRSRKSNLEMTTNVDILRELSKAPEPNKENKILSFLDKITNLFPLWVLSASILGYFKPSLFTWFSPYITAALAVTMIGMGMTLTISDFKRVIETPQYVLIGFLAQYTVMPLAASYLSKIFQLGPELSAGLILVGCAPGGTASNLVTLIAKADLALSVLMTAVSTVAAVFMTPFLTSKLAGSYVAIKASELVMSTLSVVLAPLVIGLGINTFAPKISRNIGKYTPFLSVLLVSAICGTISASNVGVVLGVSPLKLISAILLLHSTGFLLGYGLARTVGAGEKRARTISIETGMQNSALAVVLAKHMPNPVLTSLPGALSATCHSLIGSLLAAYWRYKDNSEKLTKVIEKRVNYNYIKDL